MTSNYIREQITETLARVEYTRLTAGQGAPSWEKASTTAQIACRDAIRQRVTDVLDEHGFLPVRAQEVSSEGKWRWVGKWNKGKAPQ